MGWNVQSRVGSGSRKSPGVAARVRGTLRRADRAFFFRDWRELSIVMIRAMSESAGGPLRRRSRVSFRARTLREGVVAAKAAILIWTVWCGGEGVRARVMRSRPIGDFSHTLETADWMIDQRTRWFRRLPTQLRGIFPAHPIQERPGRGTRNRPSIDLTIFHYPQSAPPSRYLARPAVGAFIPNFPAADDVAVPPPFSLERGRGRPTHHCFARAGAEPRAWSRTRLGRALRGPRPSVPRRPSRVWERDRACRASRGARGPRRRFFGGCA